jgi:hypothetical protein
MTNRTKSILAVSLAAIGIVATFWLISYCQRPNKAISNAINTDISQETPVLGEAYPDAQWTVIDSFNGYQTKLDETKLPQGANGRGQNTTANNGDRISIRNLGYELFPAGTASSSENKIQSIHTFRKRSGENIMMRSYSTFIEYYEEGNDTWEYLKTGLTADKPFGYADQNINLDQNSYTYFGNATNDAMRWNGSHTLTNGAATSTTLMVDSTTGFYATGDLILCGAERTYNAKTATTFTLTGAPPTCADNKGVVQATDEYPTYPKGNIYMTANNRVFISGVASSTQAVWFSKYGDATIFLDTLVSDSTADAAGIFNLGEGGGGVIAMTQDENAIYIFKRSIIYRVTLNDSLYTLTALKPFDGKGQTTGAVTSKSTFTGGNAVYFITPDNQIMELSRVEGVDYPQTVPISDIIKPTVDAMDFSSASGVVFRDKAYFSVKSASGVAFNDTILVWNIKQKIWDSPIVGFNANDFTVYDDGTSEELYFGEDISPNVYLVNDTPLDNEFEVTANWRSKQFNFGLPQSQKEITDMYVEGYIAPNTTLTVTLLLDEDGYTQKFSTNILGTTAALIYNSESYNTIGLSVFGAERFGSNEDLSGKKKFRAYLGKSFRALPFYTAQIDFASDGENQNFEVTSFAMKVRPYSDPSKRTLYIPFQ